MEHQIYNLIFKNDVILMDLFYKMDSFGRLPNELIENIKYFYDQPINLHTLDDDTLKKLQNKKHFELSEVNNEIEKRALKTTRIIFNKDEYQFDILRNDIYSKRLQIADLFISLHKDVKISWDTNHGTKLQVFCPRHFDGTFFMIYRNEHKYLNLIEALF